MKVNREKWKWNWEKFKWKNVSEWWWGEFLVWWMSYNPRWLPKNGCFAFFMTLLTHPKKRVAMWSGFWRFWQKYCLWWERMQFWGRGDWGAVHVSLWAASTCSNHRSEGRRSRGGRGSGGNWRRSWGGRGDWIQGRSREGRGTFCITAHPGLLPPLLPTAHTAFAQILIHSISCHFVLFCVKIIWCWGFCDIEV